MQYIQSFEIERLQRKQKSSSISKCCKVFSVEQRYQILYQWAVDQYAQTSGPLNGRTEYVAFIAADTVVLPWTGVAARLLIMWAKFANQVLL